MLVKEAKAGAVRAMDEHQAETLAERLRARGDALTQAERRLADAMLHNYPVSGLGSITALAGAAGVSTPTVARLARKLGYGGYPALQAALRGELEAALADPVARRERWAAAPEGHILNRFTEAAADNLRQSLRRIDPAAFDAVAALLADPGHGVHIAGGRITGALAQYLFTHLRMIRPGVTLLGPDAETWPPHLLDMGAGDALALFDIRRYAPAVERLAAMAAARGVTVVLFTDPWRSPAARHATHVFSLRIEAPSAWDSAVAPLCLLESLIAAAQALDWRAARTRMTALEALTAEARRP